MNKKKDVPKLRTFTESSYAQIEREINTILQAVKDRRLSFDKALHRLHFAKDDMITIYWHILDRIVTCQKNIRTLADYQEMKGLGYDIELTGDELQGIMIQRIRREVHKQGDSMEIRKVSQQQDTVNDDLNDILPDNKN